jgi:hypothetical protein
MILPYRQCISDFMFVVFQQRGREDDIPRLSTLFALVLRRARLDLGLFWIIVVSVEKTVETTSEGGTR